MKIEIKKRLLSFAWRLGGMIGVAIIAFAANNLDLVNASPQVITVVGLLAGELTKFLSNYVNGKVA